MSAPKRTGKTWVHCDGGCGRQRKRWYRRKTRRSYCCRACQRTAAAVAAALHDDDDVPFSFRGYAGAYDHTMQRLAKQFAASQAMLSKAHADTPVGGRGEFIVPLYYKISKASQL